MCVDNIATHSRIELWALCVLATMVSVMANDPLCLNAPGPAGIPASRAQCPNGSSLVDIISNTPSRLAQDPRPAEQRLPYENAADANEESWKARLLRLLSNRVYAPSSFLASKSSSQRAQV